MAGSVVLIPNARSWLLLAGDSIGGASNRSEQALKRRCRAFLEIFFAADFAARVTLLNNLKSPPCRHPSRRPLSSPERPPIMRGHLAGFGFGSGGRLHHRHPRISREHRHSF